MPKPPPAIAPRARRPPRRPDAAGLAAAAGALLALAVGCGGGAASSLATPARPGIQLTEEEASRTTHARATLDRAIIDERARDASGERAVAELEARAADDPAAVPAWLAARADLGVRRRFIACLEACRASGRRCPPRLDEPAWSFAVDDPAARPPLDAPLRFDLAGWRAVAAELHGRACACRTMACVDGVGVAIDQLEGRPAAEVQGDEEASAAITQARACLHDLRGRGARPPRVPGDEPAP